MHAPLTGVIPPIVVPLTDSRELDIASFERLINRMIEAGVHGLFFLGSSGEVVFSPDHLRKQILHEGIRIVNGRVPVLAGVIDTETPRVIEQAKRIKDMGVDALVATAPFYALGGPAETQRHFELIREAVDMPLFAYDIPVCVHQKLDYRMLVQLGKDGVLDGVKDSSADDVSFRMMVLENQRQGRPLSLLTGHEVVVDGAYLSGADGSVPGLANVDPHGYVRMWDAFQRGDWQSVRTEQDRLALLMRITMVVRSTVGFGAGIGAFKTALQQLGVFTTNQMPLPVAQLQGEEITWIRQVLVQAGLIDE
ncbi:MAG: dihydrodipicolinate synthase family protein [Actinomycetaceae bacterium]|nr:dihydrodipicolinate synthase family protein [Actinomycetaceae bacterium]